MCVGDLLSILAFTCTIYIVHSQIIIIYTSCIIDVATLVGEYYNKLKVHKLYLH